MHHFMSNSPWSAWAVIQQVQVEIAATPGLERGGVLILNESTDVKAWKKSAGSGRQYNGRLGKGEDESGGDSSGLCQLVGVDVGGRGVIFVRRLVYTSDGGVTGKILRQYPQKTIFLSSTSTIFHPPI